MDRKELEALLNEAGRSAARPGETYRPLIESHSDGTRLGVEYFKGTTLTGSPSVKGYHIPQILEGLYPMLEARRKQNEDEENDSGENSG